MSHSLPIIAVGLGLLLAACRQPEPASSVVDVAPADSTRGVGEEVGMPPTALPPVTLPRTEVRLLPSRHVEGITYELYVSMPRGYANGSRHYQVVYLLDADYSFALARNIVEHLADRGDLPPLLLVGIAYDGLARYRVNRTRDYTPTHVPTGGYGPEVHRHSGGAPAFRRFLRDELLPFVEQTYRVTGERTLVGHSYGGLFGTWAAFTPPELFDHYLLVSPSLWYDDRVMFEVEEHFSSARDTLPITLYFAVGDLERNGLRDMPDDLRAFVRRVEQRGYHALTHHMEVMDGETHNSVFPRALSNGLRAIYR